MGITLDSTYTTSYTRIKHFFDVFTKLKIFTSVAIFWMLSSKNNQNLSVKFWMQSYVVMYELFGSRDKHSIKYPNVGRPQHSHSFPGRPCLSISELLMGGTGAEWPKNLQLWHGPTQPSANLQEHAAFWTLRSRGNSVIVVFFWRLASVANSWSFRKQNS